MTRTKKCILPGRRLDSPGWDGDKEASSTCDVRDVVDICHGELEFVDCAVAVCWDGDKEEDWAGCEGCVVIDRDFNVAEASLCRCDDLSEGEETWESIEEVGTTKVQGNKTNDSSLTVIISFYWQLWAFGNVDFVSGSQRGPFFTHCTCLVLFFFLLKSRHFLIPNSWPWGGNVSSRLV